MPLGPVQLPQEGPKIGKQVDASEMSAHTRAAIGDFEAELKQRNLPTLPEAPPPPAEPPPLSEEAAEKTERGIETLEALQAVMNNEEPQENPSDPIEEAAEPTDEEKQEFIRCMLGDRQYNKTFELFGGTDKITLGDLTPVQEEALYSELAKAQLAPSADWDVVLDRLRLLAYARGYSFNTTTLQQGVPITVEGTNYLVQQLKSATRYGALMRCARIFRRHLEIMLERSLDSDFWRVDGSNSLPEPLPEDLSTTDESPEPVAGS